MGVSYPIGTTTSSNPATRGLAPASAMGGRHFVQSFVRALSALLPGSASTALEEESETVDRAAAFDRLPACLAVAMAAAGGNDGYGSYGHPWQGGSGQRGSAVSPPGGRDRRLVTPNRQTDMAQCQLRQGKACALARLVDRAVLWVLLSCCACCVVPATDRMGAGRSHNEGADQ